jgi:hypothetical protein
MARHGVAHEAHVFAEGNHGVGFAETLPAGAWRSLAERWLGER